MTMDDNNLETY